MRDPYAAVSQILAAIDGADPLVWSDAGITYSATSIHSDHEGIALTATVSADDGQVLPTDNPYTIVNPPTYVLDGGYMDVTIGGQVVQVPTYVEDPLAAYKKAIATAVQEVAINNGWTP